MVKATIKVSLCCLLALGAQAQLLAKKADPYTYIEIGSGTTSIDWPETEGADAGTAGYFAIGRQVSDQVAVELSAIAIEADTAYLVSPADSSEDITLTQTGIAVVLSQRSVPMQTPF